MKLKIQLIIILAILIVIIIALITLIHPVFPSNKVENSQLDLDKLLSSLNNTKPAYTNKGEGDVLFQKDIVISIATNQITQEVQVDKSYKSLEVYVGLSDGTGDINLRILAPDKSVFDDQVNKDIFSHFPSEWDLGTIDNPTQGLWKIIIYNLKPKQQNAKAYLVVTGL